VFDFKQTAKQVNEILIKIANSTSSTQRRTLSKTNK
jgi:hypothetical protein